MQLCHVGTNWRIHLTKEPAVYDGVSTQCGEFLDYIIQDGLVVGIFVHEPDRICKTCLRIAKDSTKEK